MEKVWVVYEFDGEMDIEEVIFSNEDEANKYVNLEKNKGRELRVVEVEVYPTCEEYLKRGD